MKCEFLSRFSLYRSIRYPIFRESINCSWSDFRIQYGYYNHGKKVFSVHSRLDGNTHIRALIHGRVYSR